MDSAIQFGSAVAMLGLSGGMMFYECVRGRAGRPLKNNERLAVPYWITYLSLFLLGISLLVAAIFHK